MIHDSLKFAFFGTDEFAVVVLGELIKAGFVPSFIVTAPDARKGRGMKLTPPPIKQWFENQESEIRDTIEILQPQKLDSTFAHNLKPKTYDLIIVASYGKILPKEILTLPKHGALNVHPSLLPLYRGPSPIQSQILDSTETVGVSIMLMDEEIDHGPILAQQVWEFQISNFKFPTLRDELAHAGGKLLADTIPDWIAGNIDPQEQEHNMASYTKQIKKEDGLVDPEKEGSETLHRKFRAFTPWPGIYFLKNNTRIKITDAELKDEKFVIKKIIPEGKKEMTYTDPKRYF